MDYYKSISDNIYLTLKAIEKDSTGDFLTIVFGTTGGLLALIGLVSIFVSLNSQHLIQKLRELTWDIIEIPSKYKKYNDGLAIKEFEDKVRLYESIFNRQGNDYTNLILKITNFTLYVVCFIWFITGLDFLIQEGSNLEFITILLITVCIISSIGMLIRFTFVLKKLSNYGVVGALPKPEELLSGKLSTDRLQEDGIFTLYISAMFSKLYMKYDPSIDGYRASIGFPFKFKDINITLSFFNPLSRDEDKSGESKCELTYEEKNYFNEYSEIKKSTPLLPENFYNSEFVEFHKYHWHTFDAKIFWPNPIIMATFASEEGTVKVTYLFTQETKKDIDIDKKANNNIVNVIDNPVFAAFPHEIQEVNRNFTSNSILN